MRRIIRTSIVVVGILVAAASLPSCVTTQQGTTVSKGKATCPAYVSAKRSHKRR